MDSIRIGAKLKALREGAGMSQETLADVIGVEHQQTVGQIESGERRMQPRELLKALTTFGVTLETFTNPFLLEESAQFSWRQDDVAAADLRSFQTRSGEWVGAYRELSRVTGQVLPPMKPELRLTTGSSYEDTRSAAEVFGLQMKLGPIPAKRLATVMEADLGILVLMVDTIPGVSGAACRLPQLNVAMVNRHDSPGRRNFDLAHELFHLLTWTSMPPQWIDGQLDGGSASKERQARMVRIEQLAQNFAGSLLMPKSALDALGEPDSDRIAWLKKSARRLEVSASALKWELINTGRVTAEWKAIPDGPLRDSQGSRSYGTAPAFSHPLIALIARSISLGHLSARRAAKLLDMTLDDLGDLCDAYCVERPEELRFDHEIAAAA